MSEIRINVIDPLRSIHGCLHGSRLDYLVAALSVEPETIEELQAGLVRFVGQQEAERFFACFHGGTCEEPWDTGVAVVDLSAQLVVVDSTYSRPGPSGKVFHSKTDQSEIWLSYHLSKDWKFTDHMLAWEALAERRRTERLPPVDTRAVLYGKICAFIARECLGLVETLPMPNLVAPAAKGAQEPDEKPFAHLDDEPMPTEWVAVHARWLETPREDLRGQAPRNVLLARCGHIGWDIQDRSEQWSLLGGCPPGLSRTTRAYGWGGFGTHEVVLYYYLLRYLLARCGERLGSARPSLEELTAFLETERDRWLNSPDPFEMHGWSPAHVIERERARLPMAVTGAEALIDHDCPMCAMAAEDFGPMFWHLDGCNMDDDFVFSFHPTREEWEAEQREYEEFNCRFEEQLRRKTAGQPVWKRSFAAPIEKETPPAIILWGVGANLAELTEDLKEQPDGQPWIDALNRDFGNLREVVQDPTTTLLDPVIDRFVDTLFRIADARIELEAKCNDLRDRLFTVASRSAGRSGDEELPFF